MWPVPGYFLFVLEIILMDSGWVRVVRGSFWWPLLKIWACPYVSLCLSTCDWWLGPLPCTFFTLHILYTFRVVIPQRLFFDFLTISLSDVLWWACLPSQSEISVFSTQSGTYFFEHSRRHKMMIQFFQLHPPPCGFFHFSHSSCWTGRTRNLCV